MKTVVIGGSGRLGKKLVSKLQEFGHEAIAQRSAVSIQG